MRSVFEFQDYKKYLQEKIKERDLQSRGERSRMAAALKCHLAYVSQVLGGRANFSLEQADTLNRHYEHTEEESDFFLLLVSHSRAGTSALQNYYSEKIKKTLESRFILKNRAGFKKTLSRTDQAIYYSAWYFAATHVLVSIPGHGSKEKIAKTLKLPLKKISTILEFLTSVGLINHSGGVYRGGSTSIHLGNDSEMIAKHHTNWRLQAIRSLERENSNDELHYSSVVSISHADVPKIKAALIAAIEDVRGIVRQSPEESVYCYALDFFSV